MFPKGQPCWCYNGTVADDRFISYGHSQGPSQSSRPCHGLPTRPGALERRFYGATQMTHRRKTKYIHEGRYVAEIDVEIVEDDTSWSPYLSVQDAQRLDSIRAALRRGDIQ